VDAALLAADLDPEGFAADGGPEPATGPMSPSRKRVRNPRGPQRYG
jgi:hypothetical protein